MKHFRSAFVASLIFMLVVLVVFPQPAYAFSFGGFFKGLAKVVAVVAVVVVVAVFAAPALATLIPATIPASGVVGAIMALDMVAGVVTACVVRLNGFCGGGSTPTPSPTQLTCEERGDCPRSSTCEERGDCPTTTCEERGDCPRPPQCGDPGQPRCPGPVSGCTPGDRRNCVNGYDYVCGSDRTWSSAGPGNCGGSNNNNNNNNNNNGGNSGGCNPSQEEKDRFLADNPGDEGRMISALCGGGGGGGDNFCSAGGCDASTPACGETTYGRDSCDNGCSRTGPPCPPPASCSSFSASPDRILIPPPRNITLSWSCVNANFGCSISGVGSVGSSGSANVSADRDTTYTLSCSGSGGSNSYNTTIRAFEWTGGKLKEVAP